MAILYLREGNLMMMSRLTEKWVGSEVEYQSQRLMRMRRRRRRIRGRKKCLLSPLEYVGVLGWLGLG